MAINQSGDLTFTVIALKTPKWYWNIDVLGALPDTLPRTAHFLITHCSRQQKASTNSKLLESAATNGLSTAEEQFLPLKKPSMHF